jgi:hypothetical protein
MDSAKVAFRLIADLQQQVDSDGDFSGAARFTINTLLRKPYFKLYVSMALRSAFEEGRLTTANAVAQAIGGDMEKHEPLSGRWMLSGSGTIWIVESDLGTTLLIRKEGWPEGVDALAIAYWNLEEEGFQLCEKDGSCPVPLPHR